VSGGPTSLDASSGSFSTASATAVLSMTSVYPVWSWAIRHIVMVLSASRQKGGATMVEVMVRFADERIPKGIGASGYGGCFR